MTDAPPNSSLESVHRNRRVATIVVSVAVAMVGAAYAAVPLYAAFCKASGYGGTTQVARAAPAARGARTLSVSFDANVAPGLDWTFEPESATIALRTGATATVYFRVHNRSARETAAVAVFNVAPEVAGAWFDKVSCFCFSEQHLGPNETAELPVVFFLDPRLEQDHTMNDVAAITLSYTLFAASDAAKPVALAPQAGGAPPRL
ncbi:MAG: cytochrome c oxidase assembly protein [Roseiarcus sp.]|jgi:cytochrome c oxidase assembly protein subunit 11